jgi:serine/threonine-protein kinase HipA
MKTKRHQKVLHVYMNSIYVGTLIKQSQGALKFQYATEWLTRKTSLPISRSLPLREDPFIGEKVDYYFDNLLPDNQKIRQLLARKTRADSENAFDLLTQIGRDCIGAIQLLPDKAELKRKQRLNSEPIKDSEIARRLRNLSQNPLAISLEDDFRISLAGAQEKTAFLKVNNKWHIPHSTTPTTHIFKPSMGMLNGAIDMSLSVENEWLCSQICKAFDLPIAETEMQTFDGIKTLISTRFDRMWNRQILLRVPQEDFCQSLGLPSHLKYQNEGGPGIQDIMNVLRESNRSDQDRYSFMKAQGIYWLLAAIDGHAKNYSITWGAEGFVLAPFYDILSAHPLAAKRQLEEQKLKMAMAIGKSRHYRVGEIFRRHWLQSANLTGFPEAEMDRILNDIINETPKVIDHVSKMLPKDFPAVISDSIFTRMLRLLKKLTL